MSYRGQNERCTRLWVFLNDSFTWFGRGNDGIEVDFKVEFTTVFTILQDGAYDVFLGGVLFENVERKSDGAQE